MKIAYFTDTFYPYKDGVVTHITTLLKRLRDLNHEIIIVAPKYKDGPTEKDIEELFNVRVILLPSIENSLYSDLSIGTPTPKSLMRLKSFDPDIIHFFTPLTVGAEAVWVAKILKKPLVATFCTYFMEASFFKKITVNRSGMMSNVINKTLWQYATQFHKPTDVIIAPSQYVANDLKKRWQKKYIEVIPGGIECGKFCNKTNRKQLRKRLKLTGSFVVLWVGRLSQEKNIHILIEAFADVYKNSSKSKLVLIGDGPARQELEFLSNALGIKQATLFLGSINYQELVDTNYYSLADIFVSPSTYETQGLSVIEAMAAGLPIVAPNIKAMPEIIDNGGMLFIPNDPSSLTNAINKLADDEALRTKISKEATKKAQEYSVENCTGQLLSLYEKIITQKENP